MNSKQAARKLTLSLDCHCNSLLCIVIRLTMVEALARHFASNIFTTVLFAEQRDGRTIHLDYRLCDDG
eukprot:3262201-Amphidinium_carterae.1